MNPADDGERVDRSSAHCAARIFAARSALTCWSESISSASARSLALSEARSAFLRSRASPSALLRRDQLVAEDAHLVDAHGDDLRLRAPSRRARPSCARGRPRPRSVEARDRVGDLPVARGDEPDVVEAVDEVREAARREQERRARRACPPRTRRRAARLSRASAVAYSSRRKRSRSRLDAGRARSAGSASARAARARARAARGAPRRRRPAARARGSWRRRRRSRSGARPPSPSPPATRPCSDAIRVVDRLLLVDDVRPGGRGERRARRRRPIARRRIAPRIRRARPPTLPVLDAVRARPAGWRGSGTITGPGGSCGTGSGSGTITGPGGSLGTGVGSGTGAGTCSASSFLTCGHRSLAVPTSSARKASATSRRSPPTRLR